jgi:hypothetical protein
MSFLIDHNRPRRGEANRAEEGGKRRDDRSGQLALYAKWRDNYARWPR